jgi:hypothetical protein
MSERIAQLKGSRAAIFFNSFSPSSKAALIFAIPFTIVDAIHYYTAGTALVLSLPVVILIYLSCGFLAGRLTFQENKDYSGLSKIGATAGMKLWMLSTIINLVIGIVIGVSSLGLTLLLGIPYLITCAPVLLIGGAILGYYGGSIFIFLHQRTSK